MIHLTCPLHFQSSTMIHSILNKPCSQGKAMRWLSQPGRLKSLHVLKWIRLRESEFYLEFRTSIHEGRKKNTIYQSPVMDLSKTEHYFGMKHMVMFVNPSNKEALLLLCLISDNSPGLKALWKVICSPWFLPTSTTSSIRNGLKYVV